MTALLLCPAPLVAETLVARVAGHDIARLPMPEGQEICLTWAHSVTGGAVADCFVNRAGRLVLDRAYLHDFAAGLGEVRGRGTLVAAPEGGYWIMGIDEALPDNRLTLRIGPARVGHRLGDLALSELVPDRRATLELLTTADN